MFGDIYRGKKVLITGNTGFKGSWLTCWLLSCGAEVYGYSIGVPSEPSMYKSLGLEGRIRQCWGDIRDAAAFDSFFRSVQPDFVFHLAAQAIVSVSYSEPLETVTTNVVGTAVVLDALRCADRSVTAVIITSDKAYDNVEWIWGYRENDRMGGKDVYSGSKGAAELVYKSYWHSFLRHSQSLRIGVARAGNVIGGGDWSRDRIVVDTINAFSRGEQVEIRSPRATRPWQHVLEPLSGYLTLGWLLEKERENKGGEPLNGQTINGEAFNFGPKQEQLKTVYDLVVDLSKGWGIDNPVRVSGNTPFDEAKLLKLNCDKALAYLGWHSTLHYSQTVDFINQWYKAWYKQSEDMYSLTLRQIASYIDEAHKQELPWTE